MIPRAGVVGTVTLLLLRPACGSDTRPAAPRPTTSAASASAPTAPVPAFPIASCLVGVGMFTFEVTLLAQVAGAIGAVLLMVVGALLSRPRPG